MLTAALYCVFYGVSWPNRTGWRYWCVECTTPIWTCVKLIGNKDVVCKEKTLQHPGAPPPQGRRWNTAKLTFSANLSAPQQSHVSCLLSDTQAQLQDTYLMFFKDLTKFICKTINRRVHQNFDFTKHTTTIKQEGWIYKFINSHKKEEKVRLPLLVVIPPRNNKDIINL